MMAEIEASQPSKFQEAMRDILDHIPQEQLLRFHPTKGVLSLWHNSRIHKIFAVTPDRVGKDAERSAEYRHKGNKLFQEKKFDEALEMFNLSVMFAPFPKETNGAKFDICDEQLQPTECGVNSCNGNLEENHEIQNGDMKQLETTDVLVETDVVKPPIEVKPVQKGNKKRANQKRNRKRKSRNCKSKCYENATTANGVGNSSTNECNEAAFVPKQAREQSQGHSKGQQPKCDDLKGDTAQNGPRIINGTTEKKPVEVEHEASGKCQVSDSKREDANTMSYVVANRSASLFFLHLYKECIADIDLAFKLGYPDELAYKLHERKAKCLVQLGQNQEAIEAFQKATMCMADADMDKKAKHSAVFSVGKQIKQIKDGKEKIKQVNCEIKFTMDNAPEFLAKRSPKFHSTSTAFKMAVNDTRGRHVVAGEDVAVAEMVSCEEPYCSILYPEYHTTHCNRCLCRVIVATPCRECSNVLYCSTICEQKAWELYHQVECPVLSWLHPTWVGRLGHLAFRTVLVAGYTNLKTYFCNDTESAKLKRMSAFNNDGTYSSGYNSIYHLVANLTSRSPENIFNFSLLAMLLMKVYFTGVACLFQSCGVNANSFIMGSGDGVTNAETSSEDSKQKVTPSGGKDEKSANKPSSGPSQKQLEILSLALMHHLQIIQCNAFAIPEMQGKDDFRTYVPRDIGVGLYPVHGLLNHSCDPDLDICFYGNRMVARAIKGITKGNEICLDYGVLYFTQPKDLRQATLMQQYYFKCACPACKGDWPLWHDIECVNPTFRCGSCRAPLPSAPPGSPVPSHVICMCGHETAVLKNLSLLNESHQRYAIAMKLKDESNNDSILLALVEHLSLMDKFICPPWRDYVSCQSSVKQSFRLMGNWFRVRGEIPPAE